MSAKRLSHKKKKAKAQQPESPAPEVLAEASSVTAPASEEETPLEAQVAVPESVELAENPAEATAEKTEDIPADAPSDAQEEIPAEAPASDSSPEIGRAHSELQSR